MEENKWQVTKKSLIDFYLDFVNNFLTIQRMADHYEMPEEDCEYFVDLGKELYNKQFKNKSK